MSFGEDSQQGETFLDVPTGDAVESKAQSAGEYKIKIVAATIDVDKNGHDYFLPRFEIVGEPYAKDLTKFHGLPHDDMTEKQSNAAKYNLDQFKKCFGLPSEGKLLASEMIGLDGWAILGVGPEDPEYGVQNYIRRYVAPK